MSTPKDQDNLFLSLPVSPRPQARVQCTATDLAWLPHLTSSSQPCFLFASPLFHFHFVLFGFVYPSIHPPVHPSIYFWPGIYCVDQAALRFVAIFLLLPPKWLGLQPFGITQTLVWLFDNSWVSQPRKPHEFLGKPSESSKERSSHEALGQGQASIPTFNTHLFLPLATL